MRITGTYQVTYPRQGKFEAHEDDMESEYYDNCLEAEAVFDKHPICARGVFLFYHDGHGSIRTIKQKGHADKRTATMWALMDCKMGEPFILENELIQSHRDGRTGHYASNLRRVG